MEDRSWPWWTCERRISTLQHEERCLSNCHLKTISQVTSTCAGRAAAIQSVRHTRRCTELERGGGIYTQQPETNEGKRVPVRVERPHQGITIAGEKSAVECLIRMISKRYEIKKQVIGEDPDLEKIWKNNESRHQVESQRFHS